MGRRSLHLDHEHNLVRDVRELRLRCVGAGARGAPAHAPATWNDGVDGALLCHLLFSLHDDQAHGAYAGPGSSGLLYM